MTDAKTLAYINLYGILGALENLCELDAEASALAQVKRPVSIAFSVKGGPDATITFKDGRCRMEQGVDPKATVLLPFSSCEKFNGLIDGTVTPIPVKGFHKIGFLLKNFTKLTDILTKYLRATEEDLKDPDFFRINTILTLGVVGVAVAQVANQDEIGRFSAAHTADGSVMIAIKDEAAVEIRVKDHHFVCLKKTPEKYRASMVFVDLQTANALFNGTVNALTALGTGKIEMHGLNSMLDNINRILDRVGLYLA